MILFAALGLAAYHFLAWKPALPAMVLLGLILAPLVPAKGSCSIRDEG